MMLHKFIFLIKRTQFLPVGKIKLPHKTYIGWEFSINVCFSHDCVM